MRKVFKIVDLDCADCVSKMESDINKLTGVISARINFLTQKLTLETEDSAFDDILMQAQKIVTKYEPDASILV